MANQRGFTIIETLIGLIVVAAIIFGGWWVWHNHQKGKNPPVGTIIYTDSAQKFTLKYPSNWKLQYLSLAGGEGAATTPDYSKVSRPFTLLPPGRPDNQLNINFGDSRAISADIAAKDKFHTITNLTINGQKAIYDKLDFVGPSSAEKYVDDTYIVENSSQSISLKFRENYYHNSPYENWNDSQDLAGFKSIVYSVVLK